jgi:hypothetical protein
VVAVNVSTDPAAGAGQLATADIAGAETNSMAAVSVESTAVNASPAVTDVGTSAAPKTHARAATRSKKSKKRKRSSSRKHPPTRAHIATYNQVAKELWTTLQASDDPAHEEVKKRVLFFWKNGHFPEQSHRKCALPSPGDYQE